MIEIETKAVRGSTVTMYKDKTFVIESVAQGDSLVTTNNDQEQAVDATGKAIFKILPNELKYGKNKIHFKVKSPVGLSKNYFYTLEKPKLPVTLQVNVADNVINNERVKIFSIVTDPLNKINIDGLVSNYHTRTGKENLNVRSYKILQLAEKESTDFPDEFQTPVNIRVVNVDGQEASELVNVSISSVTDLTVAQPEETESGFVYLTGQAPPGADICVEDSSVAADDTGNFRIRAPLPEFGPNTLIVCAGRPGEKESSQIITVNRLMPKLALTVDQVSGEQELTIKGTTTAGANVYVNGTPAVVDNDKYTWFFTYPPGISQKYTFTVTAEKEGYRTSEETLTMDQKPVFRDAA
ncbi:hypothetical protein DCCM_3922 [Desulfocucumis palustris]|uniref:Uncharacterized protein n=1 Tax=Desulfocucumis palustris TaxID=1898651 RepID=A0A2L2XFA1_9FIRM|nr:hypothetical protein DCCM_3922 [Desulfocucumis palustris]